MSAPSKAALRAIANKLLRAVEGGYGGLVEDELERLAEAARLAVKASCVRIDALNDKRRAAADAAEPGIGGHRLYERAQGDGFACTRCPTAFISIAIPAAPPCGESCGEPFARGHVVYPDSETLSASGYSAAYCAFCKTVYTVEPVTAVEGAR